ncbi:MAG: Type IV-A pilus assembly ATPase PilB [Parcubacteria group bacterium GW2011_GWA2_40_23]|nr:MAG: Type IV-A pilus assembly ATPase PilB [Parcubacteria group bacterium GW2011_GWA2_40_23]
MNPLVIQKSLTTLGLIMGDPSDRKVPARVAPGRVPAHVNGGLARLSKDLPALAAALGLDEVDLEFGTENEPQTGVLRMVSRELADRHHFVPLRLEEDGTLVIAAGRPWEQSFAQIEQDVRFSLPRDASVKRIKLVVAKEDAVDRAIAMHYGFLESGNALAEYGGEVTVVSGSEDPEEDADRIRKEGKRADVVEFVDKILLASAVKMHASDIHFDPEEDCCVVRFRIDGVLHEVSRPPLRMRNAVVSRIKILAGLDITERRLPQDGRIRAKIDNKREVDFRVATLPVLHGEKVVLRVLDQTENKLGLADLGFSPAEMALVVEALGAPHGMILCTGPTGSGKTTTLSAMLTHLNDGSRNIMTAEDPIEIPIRGISQTAINPAIQMTFASVLRSFLRSNPNIIMVGEIRDYETAEIAMQAALTGHLLLSTLHTNSAALAITRLENMGVEPFLLADSLKLLIAQRLVRRICDHCEKEPDKVTPDGLKARGFLHDDIVRLQPLQPILNPACRNCGGTGYRGRHAIYEMIQMTDEMRHAILEHASGNELQTLATSLGMKTLRQSGLALVRAGITTIDEVLRATMK